MDSICNTEVVRAYWLGIGQGFALMFLTIKLVSIFLLQLAVRQEVRRASKKPVGLLVVNFQNKKETLFDYNIQIVDDTIMRGKSMSSAVLDEVNIELFLNKQTLASSNIS